MSVPTPRKTSRGKEAALVFPCSMSFIAQMTPEVLSKCIAACVLRSLLEFSALSCIFLTFFCLGLLSEELGDFL